MLFSFDDLVQLVITETDRGDMTYTSAGGSNEIPSAVQAALLFLHGLEYFYKDIKNARVMFPSKTYLQMLDTNGLAKYRNMAYFRKSDPAFDSYEQNPTALPPLLNNIDGNIINISKQLGMLKAIEVSDVFDPIYQTEKQDIYYQAGNMIYAKSSVAFQFAQVGWYAWPNVGTVAAGYKDMSSWIAQEYPFAVVYWAASKIFQATGQQEMSRKYDSAATPDQPEAGGLVQQQIKNLMRNNIRVEGY